MWCVLSVVLYSLWLAGSCQVAMMYMYMCRHVRSVANQAWRSGQVAVASYVDIDIGQLVVYYVVKGICMWMCGVVHVVAGHGCGVGNALSTVFQLGLVYWLYWDVTLCKLVLKSNLGGHMLRERGKLANHH